MTNHSERHSKWEIPLSLYLTLQTPRISISCSLFLVPCPLSLVTFHLSLFTFHFSLFTFHFSLFTCCRYFSLVTCHLSLVTFHFSLFTFHFSLFTGRYPFAILESWALSQNSEKCEYAVSINFCFD